jgi:hypothetical protein
MEEDPLGGLDEDLDVEVAKDEEKVFRQFQLEMFRRGMVECS